MKNQLTAALASGATLLLSANIVMAQDLSAPATDRVTPDGAEFAREAEGSAFSWELALELGYGDTFKSNRPGNEFHESYAIGEAVGEAAIGDNVSVSPGNR